MARRKPEIPTWPGDMVRQLRKEAGLSQRQLAEAAGYKVVNTVQRFETHYSAALVTFERLLGALGYELEVVRCQ